MGILGGIWTIVSFPFKLVFKKKEEPVDVAYPDTFEQPPPQYPSQYQAPYPPQYPSQYQTPNYPTSESGLENVRAKVDLVVTQIDNMKIEYETLNQRIQNIEKMVREIYAIAKS